MGGPEWRREQAPQSWLDRSFILDLQFIDEFQTGDGINFANLCRRCSGSADPPYASRDTRLRSSKGMAPSPPRAMLTQNSVAGFAKFIPLKPPPSGPCRRALPRLNFANGGTGRADGPEVSAIHPAAKICEIYSVNSPRTRLEWVNDGQDAEQCARIHKTDTQAITTWPARIAEHFPCVS